MTEATECLGLPVTSYTSGLSENFFFLFHCYLHRLQYNINVVTYATYKKTYYLRHLRYNTYSIQYAYSRY